MCHRPSRGPGTRTGTGTGGPGYTIQDEPVIRNGHVVLTDRPGIGVDVNDDALRHYLRPGTELFGAGSTE